MKLTKILLASAAAVMMTGAASAATIGTADFVAAYDAANSYVNSVDDFSISTLWDAVWFANGTGAFANILPAGTAVAFNDVTNATTDLIDFAGWDFNVVTFTSASADATSFDFAGLGDASFGGETYLLSFTSSGNNLGATGSLSLSNLVSDVAPVPVPAAGLLLLTALGGAAALRRKQKAA